MIHVGNIVLYLMGWTLFVAGQAQNSIRSTSNGLDGFEGWRTWLRFHFLDLAIRTFWSGLFYGPIRFYVTSKLEALGLPVTSFLVSGAGGWFANGFVYQAQGLLGFRVEMGEKVPPPNAQIVSVAIPEIKP